MESYSAVSTPTKTLIPTPVNPDLTPRPLRINKRKRQPTRHTSPTYATLPTGSLVPAAKVRRATTMSYPPTFMNSQSTRDHDEAAHSTNRSRAVTLATISRPESGHQISHGYDSASSHPPPKSSSRDESSRSLNSTSNPDSTLGHTVRRQHSIKHRILSRVMNSLIGKSGSSQSIAEEDSTRKLSTERSTSDECTGTTTDGRPSCSTTERSSSIGTNLETALSEFPEPPVSTLASPTTISTFEHTRSNNRVSKKLCAPSNISIVRPEVNIIPELEALDSHRDQSLYVAVEIGAMAETTRESQSAPGCGLDIVVIIDNSLFASPATLMASCETARFLSTLLDPSNDRMAIICTSPLSAKDPDLGTLMPLSCVSPRKVKATVDAILHLICAGSVPWKGEANIRCNGWKLQSMHSKELHSVRHMKDLDESSLFNKLRTTIADARTGALHGTVGDMVLDIKPGQNCTIEGVIGRRNMPIIQRGERIVALVKLRVGLSPAAGYTLTSRRPQDNSSSACDDPDMELDKLLGTMPVVILTAKLRYRHSLLPPDTHCISTTDCKLRRSLPPADWITVTSTISAMKQNQPRIQLQKNFAFHIATHHEPRQAMTVLIEDFGDGGRHSACPDYIKLVLEEIKYQARTIERFDMADYRSGPAAVTPRELRPDVWGQEHFGHGLFDASKYKPREWIMDAPDEVTIQYPLSPSSKMEARTRSQSDETADLKGKTKRQPLRGTGSENRSAASTDIAETTKGLRDLALGNKRSVDVEPWRALAYPQR
ncbi:MAG: hypothetical protein L6R40_005688 [Gallowayella cf. fulva]|nr:MAG: hypothetical protein L6R40_005688 [Xanthomendoza cf. fulva]